jgi:hypothetical protein
MQARLLVIRQEKRESKRQFLEGIESYELVGYKNIHSYCYDKVNQLAEVTLALEGTYNKTKYTEEFGQLSINNNINSDDDSGGYLN